MASSKKKNIKFKNSQRRTKRKEQVKLVRRFAMHSKKEVTSRKYKFEEYLVNCEDAIAQMIPASGRIYRLAHSPNIEIDLYPTSLWNYDTLTPKVEEIPQTIPQGSPIELQLDQLGDYLPSFNTTAKGAVDVFIKRFQGLSDTGRKNFLLRKGDAVYAYDLEDDGRMLVEKDGHVLFQPYEDFCLSDHISKEETPILLIDLIKS